MSIEVLTIIFYYILLYIYICFLHNCLPKKNAFSGQVLFIGTPPGFVPQLLLCGQIHLLRPPEWGRSWDWDQLSIYLSICLSMYIYFCVYIYIYLYTLYVIVFLCMYISIHRTYQDHDDIDVFDFKVIYIYIYIYTYTNVCVDTMGITW